MAHGYGNSSFWARLRLVVPRGLQGLSPKGGIGVLGYIRPTTFSISAPIHHHGDIPLPPPCCSMGFHPHIPGSHPCPRFHPHQSRVLSPPGGLSPPEVSSSPSMVHDHTFAATWRVVGGCCFYEGKGPLVSVRAHPRPGVYVTSGYLQSSDISTRGHSRGMGPC